MSNFSNIRKFSPAFLLVLTTISTCIYLSIWQYHRFLQKKSFVQIRNNSKNKKTLKKLTNPISYKDDNRKFDIKVNPKTDLIFLRDNVYLKKTKGYLIYMPIEYKNDWYIAKVGWTKNIPSLSPLDFKSVHGVIYCPKGKEFILKRIPPSPKFPKIIQRFDIQEISKELAKKISPCILELETKFPQVKVVNKLTPERHLGYSIQWLIFAFLISYIYYRSNNEKT